MKELKPETTPKKVKHTKMKNQNNGNKFKTKSEPLRLKSDSKRKTKSFYNPRL